MENGPVTLKKISRLSGYSVSTVSKALNDKKDISLETRELIMAIAKKNNYVPNYYATALRKKQAKTLAVIIPEISNLSYAQLLSDIQKMSYNLNYRLMVLQSFNSQQKEKECLQTINDGSVNGALLITTSKNHCCLKNIQVENMLPTVLWKLNPINFDDNRILEEAKKYFNKLLLKI